MTAGLQGPVRGCEAKLDRSLLRVGLFSVLLPAVRLEHRWFRRSPRVLGERGGPPSDPS